MRGRDGERLVGNGLLREWAVIVPAILADRGRVWVGGMRCGME